MKNMMLILRCVQFSEVVFNGAMSDPYLFQEGDGLPVTLSLASGIDFLGGGESYT